MTLPPLRATGLALALGSLLPTPARATGPTATFPRGAWERVEPEAEGLSRAGLQAAVDGLEACAGRDGVRELLIVRRGRVVWEGPSVDRVHGVWSCTKTATSTVLGLLVDDRTIGLDTRAAEVVPSLAARYPLLTVRHLASMTSGYSAVGDEPLADGYVHGPSRTPFLPGPPRFPPGERFEYWDSAYNQLARVLTRAAGEPLGALFARRLAGPIGMREGQWRWEEFPPVDGVAVSGGAGNWRMFHVSARDLARVGLLFLAEGRWDGREVLSRDWVRQATSAQVPPDLQSRRGGYGFGWWVNAPGRGGARKWPRAPDGTFSASGYNNNDLFVVPEWGMVVVRLGLDQEDRQITDEDYDAFLDRVRRSFLAAP